MLKVLKHDFKAIGRGMYKHKADIHSYEAVKVFIKDGENRLKEIIAGTVGYPENGYGMFRPNLIWNDKVVTMTWESMCSCD